MRASRSVLSICMACRGRRYSDNIPLFRPENNQLDTQQTVRQRCAQTVHQLRDVLGIKVHRHVAILKDLRGYHRRGPEKSTDARVGGARPDAGDPESDLD